MVLEKEHKNQMRHRNHNESNLLREKRIADKHAVMLQSRLDTNNLSLDLIQAEHSYNIGSAVKEAKINERSHFSGLLQSHKELTKVAVQSHKDDLQSHEAVLHSYKEEEGKHLQSRMVSAYTKH